MKYCPIVFLFVAFTFVAGPFEICAVGAQIIAPPGLENVDGSSRRYVNDIPDTQPNDVFLRHQELFLASEFDALQPNQNVIRAIRWRPDISKPAGSTPFSRVELYLSTTSATPGGGLSSTLDDNVGTDATLVYDAPLTLVATEGTGDPARPFEYVIEFETPYTYDSSAGNLLIDRTLTLSPGLDAPIADAHDVGEIRTLLQTGADVNRQSLVMVTEFSFVPEPSSMSLGAVGMLVGLAMIRRRRTNASFKAA
jgi:hypothetical protein